MQYRSEIDGLRALAVVPVILFHAGFELFSGGFVGVDVFFVISGFLITGIIVKELEQGTFTLGRFYDRRLRRILPALLFVLLCCIPFAWAWMIPEEFSLFSGSIVTTILSVSNVFFYRQIDYFSPSAENMPLLHTWSLGVEEQFYVFFPLILMAIWRLSRRRTFLAVLLISLASFVWAEISQRTNPMGSFYLLPSRAWELGAGALAALWVARRGAPTSNAASALGVVLIAGSILFYDASTPSPSVYILAPVLGTVLVLLCTAPGTLAHRLLTWRPFVWIGLVSYSAYLWHQPLFAFARIRMSDHPDQTVFALLSLASFGLAYISWRFVEAPFRKSSMNIFRQKRVLLGGSAALASFVAFGAVGYTAQGLPQRMPDEARPAMLASLDRGNYRQCLSHANMVAAESGGGCTIGQDKPSLDFLVVGDSFATALGDGLDVAARQAGMKGVLYVANSCPALVGLGGAYKPSHANCEHVQNSMVEVAKRLGVTRVYLVSNWRRLSPQLRCELANIDCSAPPTASDAAIAESLRGTIRAFNDAGVTPVFVGTPPRYKASVYATMMKQAIHDGSLVDIETDRSDQYPEYVQGALTAAEGLRWSYFDVADLFCDAELCKFSAKGVPVFWDSAHITGTKAKDMAERLASMFR